jgi:hypothetical protein
MIGRILAVIKELLSLSDATNTWRE